MADLDSDLSALSYQDEPHRGAPRGATVLKNMVALGIGQVITWSSSLVLVLVLPTHLGDAGFGKLSLAIFLIALLALVVDLGGTSFLTKEIARQESDQVTGDYLLNSLVVRVPLLIVACAAGVLAVNVLGYDSQTRQVFYVLIPSLVFQSFAGVFIAMLAGIQRMKPIAWCGALSKVLHSAILVYLVLSGHGVVAAAAVSNISTLVTLLLVAFFSYRQVPFRRDVSLGLCRAIFVGGLPFLVWQASLLIYGQVDILLLSVLANEEVVGWYAAAYQLISIPAFIPFIVVAALFPVLSRLANADRPAFIQITRRSINLMVAALTPLAIGTAVLAPALIDLLGYPDDFKKSVPLISVLALHIPSAAVGTFLGGCMGALDRQHRFAVAAVAAAVLNPALNLGAIPLSDRLFDNPAIGAAVVTDFTEIFMLGAGLYLLPRDVLSREEVKNLALCLLAGGLMAAAIWPLRDSSIAIAVAAGAGVYAAAALVLGIIKVADVTEVIGMWRQEGRQQVQASTSASLSAD